jgi:hypothetical protein
MMHRYFHLSIHYRSVPVPENLEPVISVVADDWIRYNSNSWVLWTDKTPSTLEEMIAGCMLAGDGFLLLEITLAQFRAFGRAEQWIWDWLNTPRTRKEYLPGPPPTLNALNALLPSLNKPSSSNPLLGQPGVIDAITRALSGDKKTGD